MHQNPHSLHKQRGVVIVVALFIVALVATMAYVMIARLERDTRRTHLILRDTQANFYAQASVNWAMEVLRNNWEQKKPDQIVDHFPMVSTLSNMDGYGIKSTIYDSQARFNINNLTTKESLADFERLLRAVQPDLSVEQAQAIAKAVMDWITPVRQTPYDKYYVKLAAPYRSAHRAMVNASELSLVQGITPKLYISLKPYITALPTKTLINIQTAMAPVFMTLGQTVTPDAAIALQQLRGQTPYTTVDVFSNLDIVKNHAIPSEKITVTSGYFLVETEVSIENQRTVLYTQLERKANGNKAQINILWQSKGVL